MSPSHGPRIDLAASASSLDAASDGILLVAGSTSNTVDPVEVCRTLGETFSMSIFPELSSERFVAVFDGGGLLEGGYTVHARQDIGPYATTLAIGLR